MVSEEAGMMKVGGPLVPTVIEETSQGERAFDIYSRLLRERIVFLGDPIDDGVEGQSTDIAIHAQEIVRQRHRVEELLALHTGQPIEKVREDTDRDFILDAQAAKDYGIVDAVVERKALVGVPAQVSLGG